MLRAGNSDRYFIRPFDHMAANAFLKTVLLGTYTIQHGFIALVCEQVHMVAPHEIGVFNAIVALTHGDDR